MNSKSLLWFLTFALALLCILTGSVKAQDRIVTGPAVFPAEISEIPLPKYVLIYWHVPEDCGLRTGWCAGWHCRYDPCPPVRKVETFVTPEEIQAWLKREKPTQIVGLWRLDGATRIPIERREIVRAELREWAELVWEFKEPKR